MTSSTTNRSAGRWVFRARAFGDDLRAAREARELSGEAVALELGMSTNTVYRIELTDYTGHEQLRMVLDLATFYNLDIRVYFERQPPA